jgi:hypothetical protein
MGLEEVLLLSEELQLKQLAEPALVLFLPEGGIPVEQPPSSISSSKTIRSTEGITTPLGLTWGRTYTD